MNSASCFSPVLSCVATVLLSGVLGPWAAPAFAASFEQTEVDQSKLIAIAAPVGNHGYQLLILEQVTDSRLCWQVQGSQPAIVDPLLLQFDFTGICSRSTDSNGYSVRLAGEDYGLQYSLRVQQRGQDLVLVATPFRDKGAPELEIGRAHGVGTGFVRLDLDPGWRFTKRAFGGKTLGHIYLTRDQSLQEVAQLAPPASPVAAAVPEPIAPIVSPIAPNSTHTAVAATLPTPLPAAIPTVVTPIAAAPIGTVPTMTAPVVPRPVAESPVERPVERPVEPSVTLAVPPPTPAAPTTAAPSALQEILAARAAIKAARSGATPAQPGGTAPTGGAAEMALSEADQPIIIPVPPPESGPMAPGYSQPLNTGLGGPVTPRQAATAIPRPLATPTTPPPTTAAPPPTQGVPEAAALIATANLPTVRIAPTAGSVPPLASPPPTPAPPAPPAPPVNPPPSPATLPAGPVAATGFAYRLIVYADTAQAQATVRSLIPDAFRVMYNGQVVLQAGLFRSYELDQARALQYQLRQRDLQAVLLTAQ